MLQVWDLIVVGDGMHVASLYPISTSLGYLLVHNCSQTCSKIASTRWQLCIIFNLNLFHMTVFSENILQANIEQFEKACSYM